MPIFSSKTKDGSRSVNFAYAAGCDIFNPGESINVTLNKEDGDIVVKSRIRRNVTAKIALSQLRNSGAINETEVQELSKSVVGRAAAGALLLGPLGALVGGMSGIGSKQKQQLKRYYVLNYCSSANPNEIKTISFEIVGATIGLDKLDRELKSYYGGEPSDAEPTKTNIRL